MKTERVYVVLAEIENQKNDQKRTTGEGDPGRLRPHGLGVRPEFSESLESGF